MKFIPWSICFGYLCNFVQVLCQFHCTFVGSTKAGGVVRAAANLRGWREVLCRPWDIPRSRVKPMPRTCGVWGFAHWKVPLVRLLAEETIATAFNVPLGNCFVGVAGHEFRCCKCHMWVGEIVSLSSLCVAFVLHGYGEIRSNNNWSSINRLQETQEHRKEAKSEAKPKQEQTTHPNQGLAFFLHL